MAAPNTLLSVETLNRVLKVLVRAAFAVLILVLLWAGRFRYDHIVVEGETYLVRVHRLTGDADILIPGDGWVPAEEAWSDEEPSPAPSS